MNKMVHCSSCGKENKDKAKFCIKCGKKIHKEKEVDDPFYTKAVGRVIAIIFFSVVIIVALFSFSFTSFLSIIISALAIFVALPYFNKFTKQKFKYRFPTWIKVISLIVLFFIAISLIGDSEKTYKEPTSVAEEELNLKDMTAEEVLDKYISYFDYRGISDRLNKIKSEKQLASGVILKSLETDESYLTQRTSLNSDWINTCNQAKNIFKQNVCGNITQNLNRWNNIERNFEILSKDVIEETGDIVKIKVEHKTLFDNTFQVNETLGESTYILKKQDENWKVNDLIDDSGKLFSETEELEKRKSDNDKALQEEQESYKKIKEIVDKAIQEQQQLNQFKSKLSTAINGVIPSERVISIDLGNYDNQTDKYVVSITYYFKDVWLADNYLQVMSDASDIFKVVFPVNSKIYQVQTTVKEKYNDDYGHTQERYLARTSIDRATYTKINWEGFKSSNLDSIAYVAFYGDSIYKYLKELEDTSKRWQSVPSSGFPMIEGAPASLCDDVKEQCNIYGECDTYEMLKSQGICR